MVVFASSPLYCSRVLASTQHSSRISISMVSCYFQPFFYFCSHWSHRLANCGQTAARRLKEEQTEGNWAIDSK